MHKERILSAILRRIDKQKNTQNAEVQAELGSVNEDEDQIEQIVNRKSKSIADVLLSEGLAQLYGNFVQQHNHPYARNHNQIDAN